jgi:HNH endonuclease
MTTHVSADLRRAVRGRARSLCEYCLVHEEDTFLGCQVDHIIAEKHGGATDSDNLAYACTFCNRAKGTDVGSIAPGTGEFTRFYNPRVDLWSDHFRLGGVIIEPVTPIGAATARILGFNARERILERQTLQEIGRYPPQEAADLLARE